MQFCEIFSISELIPSYVGEVMMKALYFEFLSSLSSFSIRSIEAFVNSSALTSLLIRALCCSTAVFLSNSINFTPYNICLKIIV